MEDLLLSHDDKNLNCSHTFQNNSLFYGLLKQYNAWVSAFLYLYP